MNSDAAQDGTCIDCVAAGEDIPNDAAPKSTRCYEHIGDHQRWLDRTRIAAKRAGEETDDRRDDDPYDAKPLTRRGQLVLTPRQVTDLNSLMAEVRRHRERNEVALRRRGIQPKQVGELLVEVGYLLDALQSVLFPQGTETPDKVRTRKYRSGKPPERRK